MYNIILHVFIFLIKKNAMERNILSSEQFCLMAFSRIPEHFDVQPRSWTKTSIAKQFHPIRHSWNPFKSRCV